MASKRRQRRKQCERKVAYDTIEIAIQQAGRLRRLENSGVPVDAYRCPLCSHFHVGHRPKSVRQSLRTTRAAQRKNA